MTDLSTLTDEELLALYQKANPEDPGILENAARGAAKGVASIAAFPAEAALAVPKAGAYLAGDQESLDYLSTIDPTGAINSILNEAGVRTDPQPGTFKERMAANTAEAVAGGLAGIGAGGMARGVIREGTQRLMAGRLGRFAGEEVVAATAGAGVRSIAQEAGLGDPAAGVSEFAANFLTGGLMDKIRLASEGASALSGVGAGFRTAERQKAANFYQGALTMAGEDPAKVAQTIRQTVPGDEMLTAGARSGSVALQSAENALIKGNPELQARFIESKKDLNTYVADELRATLGEGVSQDFIDHYRQSADWALHITEKNRQQAIEQAWKEINELPPGDFDYSTPLKRRLEEAKRVDREIERDLWSQTGAEEVVTESMDFARPFLKEAYVDLQSEVARAGRAGDTLALPDQRIMGAVKEISESGTASVDELVALRSSILDAAANAAADQNDNLARRLNKLAEGVLNTLDGASGPNAEALKQARQFSRDLNDRYSRDVIGPLLSRFANRGETVPANETMERLLRSGEAGRTNMRALGLASGGVPQEAKSYILQRFYKKAVNENGISVKDAESFIRTYQPAIEEAGLLDLMSSYVVTGRAANQANLELADLVSAQSSDVAATFLKNYGSTGDDMVNFIGSTLKSEARASQTTLKELYQNASTDLSGAALKGLQSATVDAALKVFYTSGGDGSQRLPELTTRVVNALGATGSFSPEQIERVEQLGEILHKQASAERLRAFKGQSNTPQDLAHVSFISTLAKFAGLRAASLIVGGGPGSLAGAGLVGRTAQRIAESLTKDNAVSLIKAAVFDPDLMAALLEAPATMSPKRQSVIMGFLRGTEKAALRIGAGGLRPSQATIVNEDENGR